jgi:hypothetical protein
MAPRHVASSCQFSNTTRATAAARSDEMNEVSDDLKQLVLTLADWAAGMSVVVYVFGSRVRGACMIKRRRS